MKAVALASQEGVTKRSVEFQKAMRWPGSPVVEVHMTSPTICSIRTGEMLEALVGGGTRGTERQQPCIWREPRPAAAAAARLGGEAGGVARGGGGHALQRQPDAHKAVARRVEQQVDCASPVEHRLVGPAADVGSGGGRRALQDDGAVAAVEGHPGLKLEDVLGPDVDVACRERLARVYQRAVF